MVAGVAVDVAGEDGIDPPPPPPHAGRLVARATSPNIARRVFTEAPWVWQQKAPIVLATIDAPVVATVLRQQREQLKGQPFEIGFLNFGKNGARKTGMSGAST